MGHFLRVPFIAILSSPVIFHELTAAYGDRAVIYPWDERVDVSRIDILLKRVHGAKKADGIASAIDSIFPLTSLRTAVTCVKP